MNIKFTATYVRFSSDNQHDESIDAQIRAIKDYCQKNGCELGNKMGQPS